MSSFVRGKNNPKRNDFSLVPSSTAIIIIDVQEEFSLKSRHYIETLPSVIDNINSISNAARSSKAEVVFTYIEALTSDGRDISIDYKLSGEAFSSIPGPGKAKLLPALTRTPTDIYIPKTSCSVFVSTNIDYVLRNLGIEQVVITGQLTDQCCESAVRDAADLGYLVTVAEDACIASTAEAHKKALYSMKGFSRLLSATHIVNEFKNAKKTPSKIKDDKIRCYGKHLNYQEPESLVENHCDLHGVTLSSEQDRFPPPIENGVILSLYRALSCAGIKSIRLMAIDVNGSIRAKSVPLKRLLLEKDNPTFVNEVVTIAEVSIGGLPTYADAIVSATGLSAAKVLPLSIDLTTMKILPYSPTTACAFGYLCEQKSGRLSSLCSRSFLRRIMNDAKSQHGINFNVGVELEFCLYKRGSKEEMISNLQKDNTLRASSVIPVDYSLFASSITLNEQGDFLDDVIDQLENQGIEIEQFHSESASGQLELVLTYTQNALQLADHVVFAKETINACAKKYGMRALFLPKIQKSEAGNGQHVHLSFSDIDQKPASKNSFSTENGISARGRSFMVGAMFDSLSFIPHFSHLPLNIV